MPGSTTYLPTDGERVRLGRLNHASQESEFADLYVDISDTAFHLAAPSGYNFSFDIDTTSEWTVDATGFVYNDGSNDRDFRIEGLNNANLFVTDGANDSVAFGAAIVDGAGFSLGNITARTGITSVGLGLHVPAQTYPLDNVEACDYAIGSSVFLGIPTITNSNGCIASPTVITDAATLYIQGVPVSACACLVTVTNAYAIWVDAGDVRFDGTITLGTITYTWPTTGECNTEQLTTNGSGTLSWAAASWKKYKNLLELTCKEEAYANVMGAEVWNYQYKPEIKDMGKSDMGQTVMTGVMADDNHWAMQGTETYEDRGVFSPINMTGNLMAAFQHLASRVEKVEKSLVKK